MSSITECPSFAGLAIAASLLFAVAPGVASAQMEQYRSPTGVVHRSFAETEAVREARSAYRRSPSVANALALGAAQASLRQFRAAIETYTGALKRHPDEALLFRWRGHRFLTLRDFERARADLSTAIELDSALYGAWYHLGVLDFVDGAFREAAVSFGRALPLAPDSSERAGSTDWLWMSLMRAGDASSAAQLLARRPDSVDARNAYARRLRLYRGEIGPNELITANDTADVQRATLSYGLGNWFAIRGDTSAARSWFRRAIETGGWPAFGFIVAEAELAGRTTIGSWLHHERTRSRCVAALPRSAHPVVTALAEIDWDALPAASPTHLTARAHLVEILTAAADALRRSLGDPGGTLPRGDPRFDWTELSGVVSLIMRRDGVVTARVGRDPRSDGPSGYAVVTALAAAIDSLEISHRDHFSWPPDLDADSVFAGITIEAPGAERGGLPSMPPVNTVAIPLFAIPHPIIEQIGLVAGTKGPRYPPNARSVGMEATVIATFVVDTSGRVRDQSMRMWWPAGLKRPRGEDASYFAEFRDAVLVAAPGFRFAPSTFGSCKVPSLVRQPFVFQIAGVRR